MTKQHLTADVFEDDVTIVGETNTLGDAYLMGSVTEVDNLMVDSSAEFGCPVLLNQDPGAPLEAATKQYVDKQNEIFIQSGDPIGANPNAELWYATSAVTPLVTQVPVEIFYSEITASVNITATTQAGAQTVINPGNVTYDGTPILLEFNASGMSLPQNVANGQICVNLWDGNTDLGFFALHYTSLAGIHQMPAHQVRRITPTPGVHNYNLRAWITPSGTGAVVASPGSLAGSYEPAFLRATKSIAVGAAIAPPAGGLEANRPPASSLVTGLRYFATDTLRDWLCDGTGWIIMSEPEQTYIPTLASVTLGSPNQINTGLFRRSNGLITLKTTLTLGTGGAFTTTPTVALPAGITAGNVVNGFLAAWMYDVSPSALQYQGIGELAVGGNVIYPRISGPNGAYNATTYGTASIPMTWAVGDTLSFFGTFPMNTRYM